MQATTVLVEGESDRLAVETLAFRLGHDLTALRVSVVPMGGAASIVHSLDRYGPNGAGHRLLSLCDAGESRGIARALGRASASAARPARCIIGRVTARNSRQGKSGQVARHPPSAPT
jgi:hypothetical protein